MYLLLNEKSYKFSKQIKSLLDENNLKIEVVSCTSNEVLMDLSKKLTPEIIIIDVEFLIDDSNVIINELRRISPESHILTMIDADHYEKLHQVIEEGIDDYLLKPLQNEDLLFKIKIGLQQKRIQAEESGDIVEELAELDVQPDQADDQESKKPYLEIADAFLQDNYEEVDIKPSSLDDMSIEPAVTDFSELESFSEETEVPAPEESLFDHDVSPETFEEELPTEPEPVKYVEDIEDYSPSEEVLEYYQGDTDDPDPGLVTTEQSTKPEEIVITGTELTAAELESKVNLQEEKFLQLDDSELFGTEYKKRAVDTKEFEDLFSDDDDSGGKIKKFFTARKEDKEEKKNIEEPLIEKNESTDYLRQVLSEEPDVVLRYEDKLVESPDSRRTRDNSERGMGRRVLSFLGSVLTLMLILMLFALSYYMIQSRISGGPPEIAGYRIYSVLSGSMSPAFDTGSVVLVRQANALSIVEGDIITFSSRNDADSLTTHRVVGINREEGLSFITRGDANNVNDPNPVEAERLVGVVTGHVPYLGYLFNFVQTRQGLILLIFVPGLLILVFELRKIFGYIGEAKTEKKADKKNDFPASSHHQKKDELTESLESNDSFFK